METKPDTLLAHAEFTVAAASPRQWPPDVGAEVAFAGRSNVGKSSAINAITGRGGLARTSKTPGRTQQIVFFTVDDMRRLVDLPGYGYAKVPERMRLRWRHHIEAYLHQRRSLRAMIIPMDARRPLMPPDIQMLDLCRHHALAAYILLTKADKLNRGETARVLKDVTLRLADYPQAAVQAFSAVSRAGVVEARSCIVHFLNVDKKRPRRGGENSGA